MATFPKTVTKVEYQKRHRNRVSVFLDEEFAFGLDLSVADKFDLKRGATLSESDVDELLFREEKRRVKEKAYRYLAGRAHSRKELRDKLARKGFDPKLIEQVLDELTEQNYLDDRAFALVFARSRIQSRPVGEKLLRRLLREKGVADDFIDAAVKEAYSIEDQEVLVAKLAEKRIARYDNIKDAKVRKRLIDFLLRRGFEWDTVKRVVEENLSEGE